MVDSIAGQILDAFYDADHRKVISLYTDNKSDLAESEREEILGEVAASYFEIKDFGSFQSLIYDALEIEIAQDPGSLKTQTLFMLLAMWSFENMSKWNSYKMIKGYRKRVVFNESMEEAYQKNEKYVYKNRIAPVLNLLFITLFVGYQALYWFNYLNLPWGWHVLVQFAF